MRAYRLFDLCIVSVMRHMEAHDRPPFWVSADGHGKGEQAYMMALQAGRMPRWRVALLVVYLAGILPLLMFFNVGLTPDVLIFVFIGAALLVGRPLLFVRDWGAFC